MYMTHVEKETVFIPQSVLNLLELYLLLKWWLDLQGLNCEPKNLLPGLHEYWRRKKMREVHEYHSLQVKEVIDII